MDLPDDLFPAPSGELRSTFAAFFTNAKFNSNGSVTVVLNLPSDQREAVMKLSDQKGYALNVAVWEQEEVSGEDLAAVLGLEVHGAGD